MTSPVAALVARQNFSTCQHISLGSWNTRSTIGSVAFARPRFDRLLLLAGTFTWVSDVYVVVMVADQMLQALDLKRCTGYLAYARGRVP